MEDVFFSNKKKCLRRKTKEHNAGDNYWRRCSCKPCRIPCGGKEGKCLSFLKLSAATVAVMRTQPAPASSSGCRRVCRLLSDTQLYVYIMHVSQKQVQLPSFNLFHLKITRINENLHRHICIYLNKCIQTKNKNTLKGAQLDFTQKVQLMVSSNFPDREVFPSSLWMQKITSQLLKVYLFIFFQIKFYWTN